MAHLVQVIMAHLPAALSISVGVVSEVIAIRQVLKYPDNDGFGGILAGILKALLAVGGKDPAKPAA